MTVDEFSVPVRGVPVVRWNPTREIDGTARTVDNFGDLIGPLVVEALLAERDATPPSSAAGRLVAVGSILQFAQRGDVVWGPGVNGKLRGRRIGNRDLDVRAVRGPFTRLLMEAEGIPAPAVYGDPGLLLPALQPVAPGAARDVLIVPNLNDLAQFADDDRVMSPQAPLPEIQAAIAAAGFVTGSSLHAMVLADALGIPSRPLASAAEHPLKYADYYAGTGRPDVVAAKTVDEALALGSVPPARWDPAGLRAAFPIDLWAGRSAEPVGAIRPLTDLVTDAATLIEPGDAGTIREELAPFVLEHILVAAFRVRAHRVAEADLASAVELARPWAADDRMPTSLADDPIVVALADGDDRAVRLASLRRERGLRAESAGLGLFSTPWRLRGTVFDARRPDDAVLRLNTQDGTVVEVPVTVRDEPDWQGGWQWDAVITQGTLRAELVTGGDPSRATRVATGGGRNGTPTKGLPTLSVIVTTHNSGPWIDEQVGSILKQDAEELEVLVVDDHSDDDTLDKVRTIQRRDPRINLIHAERPGTANARALGVAAASGEYLAFAGGADVVPRGAYSTLLAAAAASADVIVGDYLTFTSGRTRRPTEGWPAFAERHESVRINDVPSLLRSRSLGNVLIRREFWTEVGAPADTADSTVVGPLTSAYLAARSISIVPDTVLLRRVPARRSARADGGVVEYLRQELAGARSVLATDDKSLRWAYLVTMLDADSWGRLKRFLAAPTRTAELDAEVTSLWRDLMAITPTSMLQAASPQKQLVRALVAGNALESARALLAVKDTESSAAGHLEVWRSAVDTVTANPELAGLIDVSRITRKRLVEPLFTHTDELDEALLADHLEWLAGHDVRSEMGRSLLAAFRADPESGVRNLATAARTIEARVDDARWGLSRLRLSGHLSPATREPVTVVLRPTGVTEAIELGSVTPNGDGRWRFSVPVKRIPTGKPCAVLLRVPVPHAGFASVAPRSLADGLGGIRPDSRGVTATVLDRDRFALRRS